ncbi:MAG: S-layer homology domain-containing protein [bacterium]|nr:S-layer homology domain-containing protein [bacterium]
MNNRFKQLQFGLILAVVLTSAAYAVNRSDFISPQFNMQGARQISLGGTNPAIGGDLNSAFVNPASLGDVEFIQFGVTQQEVLSEFNYQSMAYAYPFDFATVSLSYGSVMLHGIPKTAINNGVISSTGQFSSGFNILQLGAGRTTYLDLFLVDKLSYGLAFKGTQQVLDGDSRQSYGLDAGAIGTFHIPGRPLTFEKAHVGISGVNLFATDLPEWLDSDKQPVGRQLFLGSSFDGFDEKLRLFVNAYYIEEFEELTYGAEYYLHPSFVLRGSVVQNRADPDNYKHNLGTGLIFERVAGFGYNSYNLSIDYNLTMHPFPFEDENTHTISLSFMGESREIKPKLLEPRQDFLTKEKEIDLRGVAGRNSDVIIYNNNQQTRTTKANAFGKWELKNFKLKEGVNKIYTRADFFGRDMSYKSDIRTIVSDTLAPSVNVAIIPSDDKVNFEMIVVPNELLARADVQIGKNSEELKRSDRLEYRYSFELPSRFRDGEYIPNDIEEIFVHTRDRIGNTSEPFKTQLLVSFDEPKDESIHYGDTVTIFGKTSPMIKDLYINDVLVTEKDRQYNFTHAISISPGKNLVTIKAITNNNISYTYYARLFGYKRFDDVTRGMDSKRDIELLATMRIYEGKSRDKFYPNDNVTRRELTRFLVNFLGIQTSPVDYAPFLDVGLGDDDADVIQAAIDEGLIVAYPDGTFRPEETVSMRDAMAALKNNTIIETDEINLDTKPITRAEFAMMLTKMPNYEQRVNYLVDWEQGYTKP